LPPCPDRLWGPPSLLSNGYQGECLKLYLHSAIHLHGVVLN